MVYGTAIDRVTLFQRDCRLTLPLAGTVRQHNRGLSSAPQHGQTIQSIDDMCL